MFSNFISVLKSSLCFEFLFIYLFLDFLNLRSNIICLKLPVSNIHFRNVDWPDEIANRQLSIAKRDGFESSRVSSQSLSDESESPGRIIIASEFRRGCSRITSKRKYCVRSPASRFRRHHSRNPRIRKFREPLLRFSFHDVLSSPISRIDA